MHFKNSIKREVHITLHAQTWRFRVAKYLALVAIAVLLYMWKGIDVLGPVFFYLGLFAVGMHFVFRWKTDGWTKSWWLYKRIPLDGE